MCLIAFAIGAKPDLPLVVAANRDEFWARPTQPLQAWTLPSGKRIYSGRDLQAGGTWLGLSQDGRVAMLTNVRSGLPEAAPRSRGELVTAWLEARTGWTDWLPCFDPLQYGGFNLVLGDLHGGNWAWVSNCGPDSTLVTGAVDDAEQQTLPPGWHGQGLRPGLYGLSNAALDTPWPKTVALKHAMQRHLDTGARPEEAAGLLDALLLMDPAAEHELSATGVERELEKALSSPFVHIPGRGYGTRSSLLVHAGPKGRLLLQEWTHDPVPATGQASQAESARWSLRGSRLSHMAIGLELALTA